MDIVVADAADAANVADAVVVVFLFVFTIFLPLVFTTISDKINFILIPIMILVLTPPPPLI